MDEPLCSPSTRSFTTHLAKFKYETRSSPTKPTHSLPSTPLRTSSRSSPRRIKLNSSPISPYFRPPVSSITSAKVELEVPDVKGKKKKKSARPFAHPSVYAHLDVLPDYTTKGLNLLMCGINPGVKSAETGCHYANPSNHYYKCLYGAGLTDKKLTPEEGRHLPQLYGIGNTNLVSRPSAEASELSVKEMREAVPAFLLKIISLRPKIVCFVGINICYEFLFALRRLAFISTDFSSSNSAPPPPPLRSSPRKHAIKQTAVTKRRRKAIKVSCGLQPVVLSFAPSKTGERREKMYFFTSPSTSARVISHQIPEKIAIFTTLKANLDQLLLDPTSTLDVPLETEEYDADEILRILTQARVKKEEEVDLELKDVSPCKRRRRE